MYLYSYLPLDLYFYVKELLQHVAVTLAALRTVVGIFSDGSSAALNLTQGDPDTFLLQFLKI